MINFELIGQDPTILVTIAIILVVAALWRWGESVWLRLFKQLPAQYLRPIAAYKALDQEVGRAVESGQKLHFTLGQGGLIGSANPVTISGIHVLDHLAEEGCASAVPPIVTVGEATILPIAQDSLRAAYTKVGRLDEYTSSQVLFWGHSDYPQAYAAGVTDVIHNEALASNVMVGRFDSELAIITEAASRQQMSQVIGTDNPVAMALAKAVTDNVLIGEELMAAAAYLQKDKAQLKSIWIQDILRLLVIILIILATLVSLFSG